MRTMLLVADDEIRAAIEPVADDLLLEIQAEERQAAPAALASASYTVVVLSMLNCSPVEAVQRLEWIQACIQSLSTRARRERCSPGVVIVLITIQNYVEHVSNLNSMDAYSPTVESLLLYQPTKYAERLGERLQLCVEMEEEAQATEELVAHGPTRTLTLKRVTKRRAKGTEEYRIVLVKVAGDLVPVSYPFSEMRELAELVRQLEAHADADPLP
jgi:hypothetical protein